MNNPVTKLKSATMLHCTVHMTHKSIWMPSSLIVCNTYVTGKV